MTNPTDGIWIKNIFWELL